MTSWEKLTAIALANCEQPKAPPDNWIDDIIKMSKETIESKETITPKTELSAAWSIQVTP